MKRKADTAKLKVLKDCEFKCWNAICELQVAMVAMNPFAGHTALFKDLGEMSRKVQGISNWPW